MEEEVKVATRLAANVTMERFARVALVSWRPRSGSCAACICGEDLH